MRRVIFFVGLLSCGGTQDPELFYPPPRCHTQPATPSPQGIGFYPPTGFPAEKEPHVGAALEAWNPYVRADHRLHFDVESPRRIFWMTPPDAHFGGQYPRGWDAMFIRPDTRDVRALVLHEAGHALGLWHTTVPGSVMCGDEEGRPHVDCGEITPQHPTSADLDEAVRVGARDPS